MIGGALYRMDGKKVGTFGEMLGLSIADVSFAGMTFFFDRKVSRYDVACSPAAKLAL